MRKKYSVVRRSAAEARLRDLTLLDSANADYNMPDDLSGLHDEFCLDILKDLPADHVPEALADMRHGIVVRKRRTLRCRIWGCKVSGKCALYPYCTNCQGRCVRCGVPMLTAARVKLA